MVFGALRASSVRARQLGASARKTDVVVIIVVIIVVIVVVDVAADERARERVHDHPPPPRVLRLSVEKCLRRDSETRQ